MKFKRMIAGFMTFVMAVAVFATPLAEYLPIQGDGITASAASTQVEKIVEYAKSRVGKVEYIGLCQAFVNKCYKEAGINSPSAGSAIAAYKKWCVSTSKDNIPLGACVYFSSGSNGHVGIHVGNNQIVHASAYRKVVALTPLDEIAKNNPYLGWGWEGGTPPEGVTFDNSILKGTPLNLGNEFSAAIQSSDGKKALTVDSNGNVSIQNYVGGANQNWMFTLADGNYYQIKNPATGKCLDVSNGGNTNDTNIQVWTDNDTSSQRFGIYGSKGQYILKVKYSTTHVVDAGGGNNNVHLWAYASNIAAQKFNIFPLFDSVTVESITSTNAVLKSTYHKPSAAKAVKYGAYIAPKDKWSNSSNRKDLSFTPQTNNVGSTFRYLSFDLTGEFGYKLSPGTTYNYSFYAVYNVGGTNVTYSSGVYSFTSKGTASHTHSYGSWTTTKAATCTSTGTETRKCSCGATETRTIAAKGHNYAASFTMDKAPSCTEAGSKSRHCTVCDAKTEITSIPAHGHEFYGWVDTEYPTCTESGVQTRYCGYCDATETRTVDALGHDYYETTIPPTVDSEGYTLHTCSRCGDSYMDNFTAKKTVPVVTGLYIKGRSGDALRLAWDQNTSADGYIIERKDGTKWTRVVKITKNTTTEYRIAKLAAGTAYKFRIRAYKMDGNTPLYSGFTAISARTNPSAVSGLMLKNANSTAVRLAWNKNTSADGYIIVQKVGNKWVRVGKITKNSTVEFRKGGLKSKTSYTFRVTSYKMSGSTALYSATKAITVRTK